MWFTFFFDYIYFLLLIIFSKNERGLLQSFIFSLYQKLLKERKTRLLYDVRVDHVKDSCWEFLRTIKLWYKTYYLHKLRGSNRF